MKTTFTAALAAAAIFCAASPAFAGADLVPAFDTATGTVTVKNVGDAPASISVVTIGCKPRTRGAQCPDPAPAAAAPYELPAFPNVAAVQVPVLAPGAKYSHTLGFFAGLAFGPGAYAFTVTADAGNSVPESNEGNNVKVATKTVP